MNDDRLGLLLLVGALILLLLGYGLGALILATAAVVILIR